MGPEDLLGAVEEAEHPALALEDQGCVGETGCEIARETRRVGGVARRRPDRRRDRDSRELEAPGAGNGGELPAGRGRRRPQRRQVVNEHRPHVGAAHHLLVRGGACARQPVGGACRVPSDLPADESEQRLQQPRGAASEGGDRPRGAIHAREHAGPVHRPDGTDQTEPVHPVGMPVGEREAEGGSERLGEDTDAVDVQPVEQRDQVIRAAQQRQVRNRARAAEPGTVRGEQRKPEPARGRPGEVGLRPRPRTVEHDDDRAAGPIMNLWQGAVQPPARCEPVR
jgi:hypothetical protein